MSINGPNISLVLVQGYTSNDEAEKLQEVVNRTCTKLNVLAERAGSTDAPKYLSYQNEHLMVGAQPIGERRREFSKEDYWEILRTQRAKLVEATYVIGICDHPLPESSFNFESRDDGVAIVSASGYAQYAPPALTRERYLMYLITCVTLLLENSEVKEHDPPAACLFDVCIAPDEITAGLRKPSLEHCRRTQLNSRSNEYLVPYEAVLRDIRRRDPLAIVTSTIGDRGLAFLLGILLAFVSHLLVAQWPRAALAGAWICTVGVAGFLLARLSARFAWAQRNRSTVFWLLAVGCGLAAVAGVIITVVTGVPHLHTE